MRRYSNILAFTTAQGGDLRAVQLALRLANTSGGAVQATRVVDLASHRVSDWAPEGWNAFQAEVLHHELAVLSDRLDAMPGPKGNLTARVVVGSPSLELIRIVLQEKHDLVIKVAAGAVGSRPIAFGSTGLHLVRKCPAPVWLLPHEDVPCSRILAAVHPGIDGDEGKYALCQAVLAHAATIAAAVGAELHVVHVHEAPHQLSPGSLSEKLSRLVALTERNIVTRLRRAIGELDTSAALHTLHGDPAEVLPELARTLGAHTLAMGSLGREGEGMLMGELAEELLLRVKCGVLCIKPAGFSSPVRIASSQPKPASMT